ncbi:MAG TPA: GNAT family protein [Solirubrobacterales bacterium]|nr:GNAT family N-acetyltransferase [Solirubrobacterales bacterium]HNA45193.1 GNAT family protein [Solirubrobacterales bacterium]HNF84389.1 GNAT family protein [Solirubrobacterales bacterium]HNG56012.1 GNAT family protein [Solirubrobacterales bacterium]HNN20299.1 GNAT family protein [Solirubrobacterales bacterium]
MSLPMIEPVRLEGDRVALEPIRADLADDLWTAAQDPEIWHWTTHLNHSREFFDGWVAGGIEGWESGERSTFVTSLRSAGSDEPARVVGSSSYLFYRPDEDVVEIGSTWLNPGAWGTGANTEAKLLMMTHAFETLGCVRVEFKTDRRNERSRAALAALPAQFEGILRKHTNPFGVGRRDSAYYSVIDDEWPEVRAALEARLARRS